MFVELNIMVMVRFKDFNTLELARDLRFGRAESAKHCVSHGQVTDRMISTAGEATLFSLYANILE